MLKFCISCGKAYDEHKDYSAFSSRMPCGGLKRYFIAKPMTNEEKENQCQVFIELLRAHKDRFVKPVAVSPEVMDLLQWKLRQQISVQVDGVTVTCVVAPADKVMSSVWGDWVAEACEQPKTELQLAIERAERAEAQLADLRRKSLRTDYQDSAEETTYYTQKKRAH